MTQELDVEAGGLAKDHEDNGDTMLIIEVSDEPCDDPEAAFVRWDHRMTPVTVADANKEYDYDPNQPFASVVFLPQLDRQFPNWKQSGLEAIQRKVKSEDIRPSSVYKYPVERLQVIGTQF